MCPQNYFGEVAPGTAGGASNILLPSHAAQAPAAGAVVSTSWEPRSAPPRAFADHCRLPPGEERQAFIWMKGWLLLQLIQSHFNLFYLGMGDRKGKKGSLPTSLQKNICKFPNSKWSGYVSARCCPPRLSGMKPLLKAFGSVQLEKVLCGFSGAVPSS